MNANIADKDAFLRMIKEIHERNADKDPEEVRADVTAAVEEVRTANYRAKIFLEQRKAKRRAAMDDELRQIERDFPEISDDAKRFLELTGDVPWEAVIIHAEGEARDLIDKYGIHFSRRKPRSPDVSRHVELFCETCDLLWLQKFPQD